MGNHRLGEPRDDENWPEEDPDEEERTVRTMPDEVQTWMEGE